MEGIELLEAELDGKRVAYTNETVFVVQVGTGKSSYDTKYVVTGDLERAAALYEGVELRLKGQKKRLVMPSAGKEQVLAVRRA